MDSGKRKHKTVFITHLVVLIFLKFSFKMQDPLFKNRHPLFIIYLRSVIWKRRRIVRMKQFTNYISSNLMLPKAATK